MWRQECGVLSESPSYRSVLREAALKVTDENGEDLYHFGYGHGYHRFIALASQLAMCQDRDSESYRTVMPEERALVLLQSVVQNPYTASAWRLGPCSGFL